MRTAGEVALAVLMARFPALREAEPNWNAIAQLPEGALVRPISRLPDRRRRATERMVRRSAFRSPGVQSVIPGRARPQVVDPRVRLRIGTRSYTINERPATSCSAPILNLRAGLSG